MVPLQRTIRSGDYSASLFFLWNIYITYRRTEKVTADDPWGFANSLEWATSCSPPRHSSKRMPRIRSERPAFDLHYPHIRSGRPHVAVPSGSTHPSSE